VLTRVLKQPQRQHPRLVVVVVYEAVASRGLCPCGRRSTVGGRCLPCIRQRARFGDYSGPLYHGTYHDFAKPKLNGRGILWLAPNPVVAVEYGSPYYVKSPTAFVWKIQLKKGAKIVDLADLSQPAVRALFESLNVVKVAMSPFGAWSEDAWRQHADFGTLEERGAIAFLKSKRVDGVTSRDSLSTTGIPHDSVALLRLGAIESMEKTVVRRGDDKRTLGEIQRQIEAWKP